MSEQFFEHTNYFKEKELDGADNMWARIQPVFDECPVGMSFAYYYEDTTGNALRSLISKKAKLAGKRFKVGKRENGWWEIGRFEDEVAE